MRPLLFLLATLLATTATAQRTELYNGRARFTEDYQRQLAAEGFRPTASGAYEKVVVPFEESRHAFGSATFMGSMSGNRLPRNPNPIPAINVREPRSSASRPAYSDESDASSVDDSGAYASSGGSCDKCTKTGVGPTGPAGPRGPAGPSGSDATITSEHLEQIATIILARMKDNPEQWRGERGSDGANGRDGSDATLPKTLFVLEFEDGKGGVARSTPIELGGVASIPAVKLQLQNETSDGSISHVDRASPLGEPIAIKLPRPNRE